MKKKLLLIFAILATTYILYVIFGFCILNMTISQYDKNLNQNECKYETYFDLSKFASVIKDKRTGEIISPTGDELIIKGTMNKDLFVVYTGSYGIYNASKKTFVLDLQYEFISNCDFGNNIYSVYNGDKIGLFDIYKEQLVMPVEYNNIYQQTEEMSKLGLYVVEKNSKYGLFDTNNKALIIPVQYTWDELLNVKFETVIH